MLVKRKYAHQGLDGFSSKGFSLFKDNKYQFFLGDTCFMVVVQPFLQENPTNMHCAIILLQLGIVLSTQRIIFYLLSFHGKSFSKLNFFHARVLFLLHYYCFWLSCSSRQSSLWVLLPFFLQLDQNLVFQQQTLLCYSFRYTRLAF